MNIVMDIAVDELTGSVENYAAFFDALKELSPVPIAFENIDVYKRQGQGHRRSELPANPRAGTQ